MVLILLILISLVSFGATEIQRTKHFSNVTTNYADALRLREILADERYTQLLKDLRSPAVHHRGKRATRNPFGEGTGEIEMTTIFSTPRKNTKRTKASEKKATKHSNLQTSTTPFVPSKSSASGKVKVGYVISKFYKALQV